MLKDLMKNIRVAKFVFKFCPGYFVFSLINIVDGAVLALSKVKLIQYVVQLVSDNKSFGSVVTILAIYGAVLFVGTLYTTIYNNYIQRVYSTMFVNKMQNYLLGRVKNVDYADFDNPEFYDSYSRALRDGTWRGINVYENFISLISSLVNTITLGTFIILSDFWLIGIVLISIIFSIFVNIRTNKLWHDLDYKNENSRRMHFYINRVFYQQRFAAEIKTTPISDLLIARYYDSHREMYRNYINMQGKILIWNTFKNIVSYIFESALVFIYLGVKLFIKFTITVSDFTSIINATNQFKNNILTMADSINTIKLNALYIDDFLKYVDYKPSLETIGREGVKDDFSELKIENINFTYPGNDHRNIIDMSLDIKKNEKLAIVGLNGAGKTTLIKLLLKFYNPDNGKILYNDQDVRNLKEDEIRRKYSIVFQDFQIYAVSIAENVLMRKYSEADDEIIWKALDDVGLSEKVRSLPDGIHTMVTREFERDGMVFSGGEKQRLVIARILVSDAKICILDEPTSSLDPLAERNINQLIMEKSPDKTIIIIAHRLSTVVDSNRIILIENGEIVESGTHDELMRDKNRYYKMFTSQASLYQKLQNN